jgi:peptide/nickel transport system permease protein
VTRYIALRLSWGVVLFFALTLVTFFLFFVLPSDPLRIGRASSAVDTVEVRDAYHLEGPLLQEYGEFVWGVVRHGDLGRSVGTGLEVRDVLFRAVPVTGSLLIGGVIIWLTIALTVGILSALRPRSPIDRAGTVFVLIGISAHPVWIALLLSYAFGYRLRWFPLSNYCDFINPPHGATCGGPVQWTYHLVLPWLALALLFAALYSRMIRAGVLETLNEEYVRTARAKGLSEWVIVRSHVLRNSLLSVVTMLGMDMGLAFSGAVFVETVFGLPGLGQLVLPALRRHDLPILIGLVLVVTTAIIILNLVVDLLYARLDPRIRMADGRADLAEIGARRRLRLRTAIASALSSARQS